MTVPRPSSGVAPLAGLRIIELAGIGPGPFAAMMLADHGAEVIRIDRPGTRAAPKDILLRSRKSVIADLKTEAGRLLVRDLSASADGLIEGFRPGVMERLGLGPDVLLAENPRIVYGRMTGWGQTGPYAQAAGHDINYIALAGALHAFGRVGEKPVPPVNMVGDFGGGAMMLAFGMLAAIHHARATGQGQVVDCAMTDGAALLMSMIHSFRAQGIWRDERGVNFLDTGAHFYEVYETLDGKSISVGAIEPKFYAEFLKRVGLADDEAFASQMDASQWPALKQRLEDHFRTRTRDEWCALLEGSDACAAPVLSLAEAPAHPHNVARGTFVEAGGVVQPAPAPRYSRSPAVHPRMAGQPGADMVEVLRGLGYDDAKIASLT